MTSGVRLAHTFMPVLPETQLTKLQIRDLSDYQCGMCRRVVKYYSPNDNASAHAGRNDTAAHPKRIEY